MVGRPAREEGVYESQSRQAFEMDSVSRAAKSIFPGRNDFLGQGSWNCRKSPVFQSLTGCSDKKINFGVPKGSRTPVAGVKGRSPGPLDDGDTIL